MAGKENIWRGPGWGQGVMGGELSSSDIMPTEGVGAVIGKWTLDPSSRIVGMNYLPRAPNADNFQLG